LPWPFALSHTAGINHARLLFSQIQNPSTYIWNSCGELRVIRCLKRKEDYDKPVLSKGWLKFVADYGLRVGDKVVLHREDDQNLGSQFMIEAKRRIMLLGEEAWGDVTS
jgi:hypothetical protein